MSSATTRSSVKARLRAVRLTDSGLWTVPTTCEAAELILIGGGSGGGGGGGGGISNYTATDTSRQIGAGAGGAGGASGYARFYRIILVPGEQIPYSVGAGGAGGAGGAAFSVAVGQAYNGAAGAKGGAGSPTQFGAFIARGAENPSNYATGPGGGGGDGGWGNVASGNQTTNPGYSTAYTSNPVEGTDWLYTGGNAGAAANLQNGLTYTGAATGGFGGGTVNNLGQGNPGYSAVMRIVIPNTWTVGSGAVVDSVSVENITRAYTLAGGGGGGGASGYSLGPATGVAANHISNSNVNQPAAQAGYPGGGGLGAPFGNIPAATLAPTGTVWPIGVTGRNGGTSSAPGGGGGGGNGGMAVRGNGLNPCPSAAGGNGGNGGAGVILIRWEEV